MKYIRGFFTFWKHFILGDDSTIAIAVMWFLLLTWSFAAYFFNAWIVVPAGVLATLTILCYNQTARRPLFEGWPAILRFLSVTAIPFVAVIAVPSLVFRFANHMTDMHYTLQPFAICLASAVFLAFVTYEIYKKFPVLIVFLFGAVAYAAVLFR